MSTAPPLRRLSAPPGRFVLPVMVVVLLAAVIGGWLGFKRVAWQTPAGHEIAMTVRGTIGIDQNLLTPPQRYRNVRITPSEMQRLAARAGQKLADYYTGGLLGTWRGIGARTLSARDLRHGKTSQWMTNWKVHWVHLDELTLLPGSANATASAEFRSNGSVINRLDYTFHLVRTAKGWRVEHEDSQFEPGYDP